MILPLRPASARHADDPREVQGRALFTKGDYQAALDIYAQLFAEKSDPVYLRNVGRCYQKLEQPEKSITAFREYLRRGHVKRGERTEVEGFIKEMEDLQKQKAATTPPAAETAHASPAPADTPPAVAPAAPAVTEAPPPPVAEPTSAPGATLTQQASSEQPDTEGSIATRWWFWTGVAVLGVGGAAAAYVATRPHSGVVPPCMTGFVCSQ
ncbi:MAG TPA: tetratricopeptide repeat protein [Polyangia bacterium]|nr:tetratricopeptide repeat protein [Polyangia bacterium]